MEEIYVNENLNESFYKTILSAGTNFDQKVDYCYNLSSSERKQFGRVLSTGIKVNSLKINTFKVKGGKTITAKAKEQLDKTDHKLRKQHWDKFDDKISVNGVEKIRTSWYIPANKFMKDQLSTDLSGVKESDLRNTKYTLKKYQIEENRKSGASDEIKTWKRAMRTAQDIIESEELQNAKARIVDVYNLGQKIAKKNKMNLVVKVREQIMVMA